MVTWILLSILTGVIAFYYYFFKNQKIFDKHGILYVPPWPIVGNLGQAFFRQAPFVDVIQRTYDLNPDAKYVGFFDGTLPVVMIRDPELIKAIGVKNFEKFIDHRSFINEDNDPLLGKNLISLRGDKWRDARTLLTPAFTSSKMKAMFRLMSEYADNFADFLSKLPADKSTMEMKEVFTRYTSDVIATCAFGVGVDSMKNPNNKFYVFGREATSFNTLRIIKIYLIRTMPRVTKWLGIRFLSNRVVQFFKDLIRSTIHTRDVKNIVRQDILQLMMDTRGKRGPGKEMTIEDITSQAFIFFFGGFETASILMSFIAHEVTVHPHVQEKLRSEIDNVLKAANGELTYDALNEMEYLDAVVNETLRFRSVAAITDRLCVEEFQLPPALPGGKPYLVKKGEVVWFPISALLRDPKYFEKPNEFYPERFLGENKKLLSSGAYLPFGIGPRICIGSRFALLETKVMLFHLLARCELKMCPKTSHPLRLSKSSLPLMAEGGFWLKIQAREKS